MEISKFISKPNGFFRVKKDSRNRNRAQNTKKMCFQSMHMYTGHTLNSLIRIRNTFSICNGEEKKNYKANEFQKCAFIYMKQIDSTNVQSVVQYVERDIFFSNKKVKLN